MNEILLRRKRKIVLTGNRVRKKSDIPLVATLLKNLEVYGYTLSKELIKEISLCSIDTMRVLNDEIVSFVDRMKTGGVNYEPMYPNFPTQVMRVGEAELYYNAIMHYLDSIVLGNPNAWLPTYTKEKRKKVEMVKLEVIDLGTEEDFFDIFKNLFKAKVAISPADKADIDYFIDNYKGMAIEILPDEIPNKENLAYLIKKFQDKGLLSDDILLKYFKTATDVLRYATALSNGDVSLASNTGFISFKKSDRRLILRMLEHAVNLQEDMVRYKGKWIRLGERLHPGQYATRYPKTFKAFSDIRNNVKIKTFNNQVEKHFNDLNIDKLIKLLKARPGELLRRLDRVLRTFPKNHSEILKALSEVIGIPSTTVILQVRTHFKFRNKQKIRAFIPKGEIAKIMSIDNNLPLIANQTCKDIVKICQNELVKRFDKKENWGKVYIDPALKNCPIPFALRSASKSLRTITRGSRIPMGVGNTIRLFIHWKNTETSMAASKAPRYGFGFDDYGGRVDIDLSAVFYNAQYEYMTAVTYYNLRDNEIKTYHSGDITNAPNGAAEFIDIDIKHAIESGMRYVVTSVNCFTGQTYDNIPECYAGCMMRKKPNDGEIFEPSTVKDRFDLTSESKMTVPLVFDLVKREVIWVDTSVTVGCGCNNVRNNEGGISTLLKAICELNKPNLYDLFKLHAKANKATMAEEKNKADKVFSTNAGVTPFDIDTIISKYL